MYFTIGFILGIIAFVFYLSALVVRPVRLWLIKNNLTFKDLDPQTSKYADREDIISSLFLHIVTAILISLALLIGWVVVLPIGLLIVFYFKSINQI